jgi:hypothetical protein
MNSSTVPQRMFVTPLNEASDRIVEIDPGVGLNIAELEPPEVPLSGTTGSAVDGDDYFLLGTTGRFPYLYRLDADSGDVLDASLTWFGSGRYGDLAILGDTLYLVDILGDGIFTMDKSLDGPVTRLDLGGIGGFSLAGPIATAASPDRLFVTEAHDMSSVVVLNAANGQPMTAVNLNADCGCNADFDADGDVDDDDAAFFEDCEDIDGFPIFDCVRADLDCDRSVDSGDEQILNCQHNGPGNPPNEGCCADDLPPLAMRATSLTGQYPHALVAGDWTEAGLRRFDASGHLVNTLPLDDPVAAVAGGAFTTLADADGDGDADLIDWAALQVCLSYGGSTDPDPSCLIFDADLNREIDINDFAAFHALLFGETP